ncbi:hypothetical protein BC943DRAFT_350157 [Umbelopsis sp. AD052]|nr:hypothetical protein BC943DRAFT_350157 [Umbelopsis sp. AD052]
MASKLNRNDLLIVSTHSSIKGGISLFINDADLLIAAAEGTAYGYDLFTGSVKWTNDMTGMGFHEVAVSSTPTNSVAHLAPNHQASNDRPPAYTASQKSVVILCSHGMVMGVDSTTGKTVWRYTCPDGSHHMPAVISEMDKVYIGCGRMVSALNPKNGQKIWAVYASNGMMGSCAMTMATVWGSRQAEMWQQSPGTYRLE